MFLNIITSKLFFFGIKLFQSGKLTSLLFGQKKFSQNCFGHTRVPLTKTSSAGIINVINWTQYLFVIKHRDFVINISFEHFGWGIYPYVAFIIWNISFISIQRTFFENITLFIKGHFDLLKWSRWVFLHVFYL